MCRRIIEKQSWQHGLVWRRETLGEQDLHQGKKLMEMLSSVLLSKQIQV